MRPEDQQLIDRIAATITEELQAQLAIREIDLSRETVEALGDMAAYEILVEYEVKPKPSRSPWPG